MSLRAIDKNIATISTSIADVNNLVHETGVMIMEHAKKHGDCTRALTLVKRMPRSFRKEMLVEWFHAYSPIRVIEKNDKVGILPTKDKRYVAWDIDAAKDNPFYMMEKEGGGNTKAPLNTVQVLALVPSLAETIEKKIKSGKIDDSAVEVATALALYLSSLPLEEVLAGITGKPVEKTVTTFDTLEDVAGPAVKKVA